MSEKDRGGRTKKRRRLAVLRDVAIVVVGALLVSTLVRMFVWQTFYVPSESMENTLEVGDRVAAQKVAGLQRGDIVVFEDTLGWLPPLEDKSGPLGDLLIFLGLAADDSKNYLVKRVIGLPGDHLVCCDAQSRITVNGFAPNYKSYIYIDQITGEWDDPSATSFDVVVPKGGLFVMGDHRSDSQDSRFHLCDTPPGAPRGTVAIIPIEDVVGTAVAVIFPLSRFKTLDRPTTFNDIPDPTGPVPDEPVVNRDGC